MLWIHDGIYGLSQGRINSVRIIMSSTNTISGIKILESSGMLLVSELYESIQGESSHCGQRCVFIRLTGCPLRCKWCDSESSFQGGTRMDIDELVHDVTSMNTPLVEVTGGEPLAQTGCLVLLKKLCDSGRTILLETSGALDIKKVDPRVTTIMDIKCPGSGESKSNLWDNIQHLKPQDELKLVIACREDYIWARDVLARHGLLGQHTVYLSPADGILDPAELADWILQDRLNVRFQIQIHKVIWPDSDGGI